MNSVSYEVRFNGVEYEVHRTRTYVTLPPTVSILGPFATRELAEEEIRFQESLDADKLRDRAGR